ncbi:MAG: transcription-repair coupling factor [SAR324 cluster bacterium]|jgi:transcription-repair coupling factor (superfamily II helicase)|nr:transcription-repair coupling factor [SAR324 cluster bacterium]MEE1575665.1 transcription-repair coupling factor [Deltaproteobacteria bacterium]MDP6248464.1 transcription-repair coupling factor [SAR324 cluster bacterium]MDP6463098.1 transcription-repair coupling factor [SAR324 cluster bacterium]MDP7138818.1 transcription-repair coupling factor [SAR324 cluster bacterium]|tara:strand:+ start:10538 stop:14152 length:3615 start_codon:yes stop_codon:yes gene_type:complete
MNVSLSMILAHLPADPPPLQLKGLRGSSKALFLKEIHTNLDRPLVVLSDSYENAERLLRDLTFFLGDEGLCLFPPWDVMPYDLFSPHRTLVGQRLQCLDMLIRKACRVFITTPHALMQKLLPVEAFRDSILQIKSGDSLEISDIKIRLQETGYQTVDMVEDQGDFSAHGNILDVFPLQADSPVRLEFSQEVPSSLLQIHPFDVQSQRTGGELLDSLTLLPGSEVIFNEKTLSQAQRKLHQIRSDFKGPQLQRLEKKLHSAERFPGLEHLGPLFYQQLDTVFEYFPENHLLVVDEDQKVRERATHFFNEIFMEYEQSQQQKRITLPTEDLYLSHRQVQSRIGQSCCLTLSQEREEASSGTKKSPESVIDFDRENSFESGSSKSFLLPFASNKLLREGFRESHAASAVGHVIKLVSDWIDEGIPVFLNARNRTQADQCRELLDDLMIETEIQETEDPPETGAWIEVLQQGSWNSSSQNKQKGPSPPIPILVGTLSSGFRMIDSRGQVRFALLTEEEIFGEKKKSRRLQRAKVQRSAGSLEDLSEGDAVVHLDYGIGRYMGLQKLSAADTENEFMVLKYARDEKVYVPVNKFHLVQKYVNTDGAPPKLSKLGEKTWKKTRSKVAKAVEDIAEDLAGIYAARKARKGIRYQQDDHEIKEFERRFPYRETEDQLEAIQAVKEDMESEMPMDRLICGDVGFGKTEVAMRAAFKAVSEEKQVAVLVPTTILAQQHYSTFLERFHDTPFNIEVLSRFRTPTEQRDILKKMASGQLDILIGTHRILSKDVSFKELGLLVVDEEQRFGVKHKEKIKQFRAEVDVVTLSATPIPRTLYMSLMGIRDLSLINTPPADRVAVRTRIVQSSDYVIQEAVSRELRRGGQVFIVHNRVETIYEYGNYLREILPDVKIAIGHGQLGEHQLEQVMYDFIEGEIQVLLSTTIIESGLDIPRANTILINNADNFGLSQLYQLRGRVGRSNLQAFAYLLVPPQKILNGVAQERLQVLQELNDLGAGFKVASRDLEIRGAGNLLGSEQSGQIASVGLELYTQMVEQAVRKIQQQDLAVLPLDEVQVRLDTVDVTIPEEYIVSTSQRLSLYKAFGTIESDEALWDFRSGIEDRFGPMPESLVNLFMTAQIRLWAQRFGVESVHHSKQRLRLQIRDSSRLQPDRLIEWLSEPQTPLRYVPENILDLQPVPPMIQAIQKSLKDVERVFH